MEEAQNNNVDKIISSQHQAASIWAIPVLARYELSVYGDRERIYAWTQKLGFLLTKAYLASVAPKSPTCQQQKPMLSSQYGTVYHGDQPAS